MGQPRCRRYGTSVTSFDHEDLLHRSPTWRESATPEEPKVLGCNVYGWNLLIPTSL